jgi:hypothetical protein
MVNISPLFDFQLQFYENIKGNSEYLKVIDELGCDADECNPVNELAPCDRCSKNFSFFAFLNRHKYCQKCYNDIKSKDDLLFEDSSHFRIYSAEVLFQDDIILKFSNEFYSADEFIDLLHSSFKLWAKDYPEYLNMWTDC